MSQSRQFPLCVCVCFSIHSAVWICVSVCVLISSGGSRRCHQGSGGADGSIHRALPQTGWDDPVLQWQRRGRPPVTVRSYRLSVTMCSNVGGTKPWRPHVWSKTLTACLSPVMCPQVNCCFVQRNLAAFQEVHLMLNICRGKREWCNFTLWIKECWKN